jgi:HK97 family phage major capsid protein
MFKTKQEIYNEVRKLKLANAAILDLIASEKRELTNVEQIELDANKERISELETEAKEFKEVTTKVGEDRSLKNKFSLIQAIRDQVEGRAASDATLAMNEMGQKAFFGTGLSTRGQIVMPFEFRGDILAGTQYAGQEVVAEDKMGLIVGLRANSVLFKAGAQLLSGLRGDVSIPVYTNSTVAWKSEVAIATDGAGSFTEINLSQKRLTGFIDLSKAFLLQDSASANQILQDDLNAAVISKLENTLLGSASGSTTQPAGIFYGVSNTVTGATTFAKVIAMESAIESSIALTGNLNYITTPAVKGILRGTPRIATYGSGFIYEGDGVNGYPVLASSNVSAGRIVFGNWADFIVGQWGGVDILIDPYSQAIYGKVRLVVNAYFDGKVRRAASFAYGSLTA